MRRRAWIALFAALALVASSLRVSASPGGGHGTTFRSGSEGGATELRGGVLRRPEATPREPNVRVQVRRSAPSARARAVDGGWHKQLARVSREIAGLDARRACVSGADRSQRPNVVVVATPSSTDCTIPSPRGPPLIARSI